MMQSSTGNPSTRPAPLVITYEDDPRVLREQATEDYNLHAVPRSVRLGKLSLNMSVWSLLSSANMIVFGALMATVVGTKQAIVGLVLSTIVFAIINMLLTTWSTRSGLGTLMVSRRVFGNYGAALTPLLLMASGIFFVVFEFSVLAVALQAYFGALDIKVWYLVVVLGLVPLMLGSVQTWMGKLNGLLLPIYAVGLIAAVIAAAVQSDEGSSWLDAGGIAGGSSLPGWLQTFVLYMGLWLFMLLTVDFGRFGRERDLTFNRHVTFGGVFYILLFLFNGFVGIYLSKTVAPEAGVSEAGAILAVVSVLGVFGLIVILATQTRISTMNFYVSSVNAQRVFASVFGLRLSRRTWILAIAAVSFVLMLTNVFSYLAQALQWHGVFFVSWVGIVLTHFLLSSGDREHGPEFRPGRVKSFAPGLTVWILSSAVGIAFILMPEAAPVASGLAPMITLVISVVLYALSMKLLPTPVLSRPGDPRDEVDDPWSSYIQCHVCDRAYVSVEMDRDPSAGGAAICSSCGEVSKEFLRAAVLEAESSTRGTAVGRS